jgi:hypothetical protein
MPAPVGEHDVVTFRLEGTADVALLAAHDNAAWCSTVCRTHGLTGSFGPAAWTSPVRTPPFYPDAVTLRPGVPAEAVLTAIDDGPGCSVKDSFADLDLSGHGFRVLFEAQWIHRQPGTPGETGDWEVVADPDALAEWEDAWRGADGPVGLFRAELLDDPAVEVLAARAQGRVVAGAVLSLFGRPVGVSNVFVTEPQAGSPWPGLLAAAAERHPGRPLVGYERGEDLAEALRHGFRTAGPLRVWLREE